MKDLTRFTRDIAELSFYRKLQDAMPAKLESMPQDLGQPATDENTEPNICAADGEIVKEKKRKR